jgi:hypothetical protein
VCLDHLARVAACRSPRRANVLPLDADLAQKGPTSPSEGPDVSLLAHNFDILAFNVTNNVILLSQPCRLFLMTYFVIKGHLDDIN